ncbi:MAG: diaminopimelate decarboxylase [candidate division KSB1 bacterium]|nr:diaminopimelate decarboxylase [candidate division KSB1 bacterium]
MTLGNTTIEPSVVQNAAKKFGTPFYLYDEQTILNKCHKVLKMPHAYGLSVSYAMKANSNRALLQLITNLGIDLDTSSLNEALRAHMAGIPFSRMELTSQQVPLGKERETLESCLLDGLKYNVCSLRQLKLISEFARTHNLKLSMRVHPGVGSGESVTRNTGDKYSCFGVHLEDLPKAVKFAREQELTIDQIHIHIGSGGDPKLWRENIDRELQLVETFFPDVKTVNLGGGFKEARMPDETQADIKALGQYAKDRFKAFAKRTGRKLNMQIEPGTYLVANAGFLVTRVMDKKSTGEDGFNFLITDGGMEANTRPLLYGSRHPFYVISKEGDLYSSEYDLGHLMEEADYRVVVGRCCESGDSQSLDSRGHIIPRLLSEPDLEDYLVVGGTGAYTSAMSLKNYNSYVTPPEVLLRTHGELKLIRSEETLEQMIQNEHSLD